MDTLAGRLPEIIAAAAQSYLGILALLSIALAVLAYFFFAKASEKVKVGIFVLLFVGVIAFGAAMFRASGGAPTGGDAGTPQAALSNEAKTLLQKGAKDPGGAILFEFFGDSVDLHTNGESLFTDKSDHRGIAMWQAALQELVKAGFLTAHGERGEVFEMTKQGYDAAERLADDSSHSKD